MEELPCIECGNFFVKEDLKKCNNCSGYICKECLKIIYICDYCKVKLRK